MNTWGLRPWIVVAVLAIGIAECEGRGWIVAATLRRELDWIVTKSLEKDRRRRYQTASDFARDVERYLNDKPIEARPPTRLDRLSKWSRRHRPVVWSA